MIAQLARLLADYLGTFVSLARTEAGNDIKSLLSVVTRWAMAAGAALLAVLWLNIALLLWLLQSPWRIGGALAVAVILLAAAWFLMRSRTFSGGFLPQTKELVRAEIHAIGLDSNDLSKDLAQAKAIANPDATSPVTRQADAVASAPQPHATAPAPTAPAPAMTPEAARTRVRALRNRIGQVLAPPDQPGALPRPDAPGVTPEAARAGFVPRSNTMRLLMNYWGGPPNKGKAGTIISSLLGYVALRNRKLRQLASTVVMARSFARILGKRLRRA